LRQRSPRDVRSAPRFGAPRDASPAREHVDEAPEGTMMRVLLPHVDGIEPQSLPPRRRRRRRGRGRARPASGPRAMRRPPRVS